MCARCSLGIGRQLDALRCRKPPEGRDVTSLVSVQGNIMSHHVREVPSGAAGPRTARPAFRLAARRREAQKHISWSRRGPTPPSRSGEKTGQPVPGHQISEMAHARLDHRVDSFPDAPTYGRDARGRPTPDGMAAPRAPWLEPPVGSLAPLPRDSGADAVRDTTPRKRTAGTSGDVSPEPDGNGTATILKYNVAPGQPSPSARTRINLAALSRSD